MIPDNDLPEVVIPKEKAVFWMDHLGRWHNEDGRFEHKRIIDYFNSSIRRDQGGYFVVQVRETVLEKVYFRYDDTPLFVVDVRRDVPIELVLNTRKTLSLSPDDLFVSKDNLYMRRKDERIRFLERALIKLSAHLDYDNGRYFFVDGEDRRLLPEE